jgi:DNA-binding beta-propeller fold protein YncE
MIRSTTVASVSMFSVNPDWERLPPGYRHADVADVAVDSADRVYLLTRNDSRVLVYERDGRFIRSFGDGVLTDRPHGIAVGPDGAVLCVLEDDGTVRRFDSNGSQIGVLGVSGFESETGCDWSISRPEEFSRRIGTITRGGPPFNHPTGVAMAPNGDLYVSDGYGNARVHQFSIDGKLIRSWGEPGVGPGQFHVPHNLIATSDGRVLVADRENDRVQVFTSDGDFLSEWTDLHRPTDIALDQNGRFFVSEFPSPAGWYSWVHGYTEVEKPSRVSVIDQSGNVVDRFGTPSNPGAKDGLLAAHGVAVDSDGNVYVAEVTQTYIKGREMLGDTPWEAAEGQTLRRFNNTGSRGWPRDHSFDANPQ